ncbi:caspase family protein [Streptomyces phaeoluteigriseus]|uniref:caspase family protein n=1 Tax=Streptomyces phaeoluteigriseus TaxID=114686 RepID=UPI00367EB672
MTDRERQALIVVTSNYSDTGLDELRAPMRDAEALVEVLGDPDVGNFDVEVLEDPDCHLLRRKVEDFFADRTPRHTLLLHFSCHGVKTRAGKLFLATTDTRQTRLNSTAIPAEYVSAQMLASRAQRAVVILDCCYAGAFGKDVLHRGSTDAHVEDSFQDLDHAGGRRGRAVFTASSAIEYADDGNRLVALEPGQDHTLRPSLFTDALVEGLRTGEADRDGDGEIGMSELADYVHDRVIEVNGDQTPQLWLFGAHGGDLLIARNRRRGPAPAPLPTELNAAVHSSHRDERLRAVDDLEELLQGNDVGLALSARDALDELTRDDSRRVSEKAARPLDAARPKIAADSLDLGTVVLGAAAPGTVITVDGPPVARATMVAKTEPWLTVSHVADGILLSSEPDTPGHYETDVLLHTATGELPVHVGVNVVAMGPEEPRRPAPAAPSENPFLLADLLLMSTLFLPFHTYDGEPYWVHEIGWFEPAVVALALAANVAIAALVQRHSPHVRRITVLGGYMMVTTMLLVVAGALIPFVVSPYGVHVGFLTLALAVPCSIWGCVTLWPHATPAPPRPG